MIKIRLHGEPDQVARFAKVLDEMGRVGVLRVLTRSDDYADRGQSAYVRRYLEVEQLLDVDVALDQQPPGQAVQTQQPGGPVGRRSK